VRTKEVEGIDKTDIRNKTTSRIAYVIQTDCLASDQKGLTANGCNSRENKLMIGWLKLRRLLWDNQQLLPCGTKYQPTCGTRRVTFLPEPKYCRLLVPLHQAHPDIVCYQDLNHSNNNKNDNRNFALKRYQEMKNDHDILYSCTLILGPSTLPYISAHTT
jgi:hypothetical protein